MFVPLVQGAAPQLTSLGECIRRHSAHKSRDTGGLVNLKQILVGPHISRVASNVDGHIANDVDALAVGILLQCLPLTVKKELDGNVCVDRVLVLFLELCQRSRFPLAKINRPVPPCTHIQALQVASNLKHGTVLDPRIVFPECLHFLLQIGKLLVVQQARGCKAQHRILGSHNSGIVNIRDGHGRRLVFRVYQTLSDQVVNRDQHREARVGIGTAVRAPEHGVGRADGQHLPAGQPRAFQPVDELARLGAQLSDAIRAWKRGRVQNDSRAAWLLAVREVVLVLLRQLRAQLSVVVLFRLEALSSRLGLLGRWGSHIRSNAACGDRAAAANQRHRAEAWTRTHLDRASSLQRAWSRAAINARAPVQAGAHRHRCGLSPLDTSVHQCR
mmetsp:Transcript_32877/g.97955  ORF Transcript_32877/g.97955 Transcript_32877/m.97955 type:complete len:386 (+) Transcript_32877:940-2097(+)